MDKGKMGEDLAAYAYENLGYKIIGRNVRMHGSRQIGEIDVIAMKDDLIVFIEVKSRTNEAFGVPAEAVDYFKQRKLINAAQAYLSRNPQFDSYDWRFDVAEVNLDKNPPSVIILANAIEDY
jgi:putative endonuclease